MWLGYGKCQARGQSRRQAKGQTRKLGQERGQLRARLVDALRVVQARLWTIRQVQGYAAGLNDKLCQGRFRDRLGWCHGQKRLQARLGSVNISLNQQHIRREIVLLMVKKCGARWLFLPAWPFQTTNFFCNLKCIFKCTSLMIDRLNWGQISYSVIQ